MHDYVSVGHGPTLTGPGVEILMVLTARSPLPDTPSGPGRAIVDASV